MFCLLTSAAAFATGAPAADAVAVPAGSFTQGSGRASDEPLRTVTLSAYRIDRTEVTVAAYERFVAEGYEEQRWWSNDGWAWAQEHPGGSGADFRAAGRSSDHPVVAVTWFEADAYCRWTGGHLPTEAQWERASCRAAGERFAWGESEEVDIVWYAGGKFGHLKEVHTVPAALQDAALASPAGLLHTAGNVWEWTSDWYHASGTAGDATDPAGPESGTWRVLRGGSFMNLPSYCTCTHREPATPDRVAFTTGFRCAYSP